MNAVHGSFWGIRGQPGLDARAIMGAGYAGYAPWGVCMGLNTLNHSQNR